jgi:hypothetical protein
MVDINQHGEFQPPYWQYQDYSAIMWAASTKPKKKEKTKETKKKEEQQREIKN